MSKSLIIILSIFLLSACTSQTKTDDIDIVTLQVTPTPTTMDTKTSTKTDSLVALTTKDGQMVIKLYDKETPNTAKNFRDKVASGFYDGLIFHRVIPGFMAQGGDPTGTGMGGGKQKSELNNIPFKRGSLGLARTAETNQVSNDSQFYICYNDTGCAHLTSDYVNFGEVVTGLDILDKIAQGDKIIKAQISTK
ncbi:MAG: peptidylprolyl isomerase [Candidatus Shapirobacteria bacterium]